MHPLNQRLISRRTMLRAAGVAIGLPLLDAMIPKGLHAEEKAEAMAPKRLVLVARPLGLHAPNFFPEKTGADPVGNTAATPFARCVSASSSRQMHMSSSGVTAGWLSGSR